MPLSREIKAELGSIRADVRADTEQFRIRYVLRLY